MKFYILDMTNLVVLIPELTIKIRQFIRILRKKKLEVHLNLGHDFNLNIDKRWRTSNSDTTKNCFYFLIILFCFI